LPVLTRSYMAAILRKLLRIAAFVRAFRRPSCCPAYLSHATLAMPGEAESGSAGVQPDEEYPGRRCTEGASWAPQNNRSPGPSFSPSDTGAMPWKTHPHRLQDFPAVHNQAPVDQVLSAALVRQPLLLITLLGRTTLPSLSDWRLRLRSKARCLRRPSIRVGSKTNGTSLSDAAHFDGARRSPNAAVLR